MFYQRVYQRMFQSVMVLFTAGWAFAACGAPEPQTPQSQYCTTKCACNKCTTTEKGTCTDDIANLEVEADGAQCGERYDVYLSCLNANGTCTEGDFDESACYNEEVDLNTCIDPPTPCPTVDNGVCNEPPPAGDDTCVSGTDTNDCMAPPTCATVNDGTCDEPEGTNKCPEGTDPTDCMCARCGTYVANQAGNMLCPTSNMLFNALYECACDINKCLMICGLAGQSCGGGPIAAECSTCITSSCLAEQNACVQDG